MASTGKFTDKGVAALKATDKRRMIWEPAGHGQGNLGVRLAALPSSLKTWIFMFRIGGKARMLSLGTYPAMSVAEAHAAGAKAAVELSMGLDPAATAVATNRAERAAPTVAALAEQYLELYARPRKKSADRDEALLRRNVLPTWGTHKATAIVRSDVAKLLDGIIARGAGIQSNRTHSVLSRMFNWAVERQIVEQNPVTGLRAPIKETSRERCLSDEELSRFLSRLDDTKLAAATRLALRFAVLTAARPGEVVGATWAEIDEGAAIWHLPGARTKNGEPHNLPLSAQALAVLNEARKLDRGAGCVFPSPQHSKGRPIDVGALAHAIGDNLTVFGVEPFYAHDLRRTAATGMAELGADWTLLQKLLNHKLRGETAKYVRHGYAAEMRAILEKWGAKVAELEAAGVGDVAAAVARA